MTEATIGAEAKVLRPPTALLVGGAFLILLALTFTTLLGLDGEGDYWTQATAILCMALVLFVGLVTVTIRLILTPGQIRVVNWTEEWRLPAAEIVEIQADDGLSILTKGTTVRSSVAQPSVLGSLTGYRRAQRLRSECLAYLDATTTEPRIPLVHRRRWALLLLLLASLAALWVVYSAAYMTR